jgi:DNA-binding transcriptional LysR family regulator
MDLLAQMKAFVRIVESGSLTAAARQLRVSAGSVSRQLSSLERTLGAPLLLRTTRRSTLTDAGRQYYERCRRVLHDIEDAQESVRADRTAAGTLIISAPVTFGLLRICPHLPAFHKRYPGISVDLRLEDRVVDIVSEGVDIAIRSGIDPPDSTSLVAQPLTTFERVLVASPDYLSRRGEPRTPEALTGHDLVFHLGGQAGWRIARDGREVRVDGPAAFRSNAMLALKNAALQGTGIAMLPEWLVRDDIRSGALRALFPAWSAAPVRVFLFHRIELRGALRVRAFIDHLRTLVTSESISSRTDFMTQSRLDQAQT